MSRASEYSGSPQGFSQHRAVRPRLFFHRLTEVHFTVHPFTSLQVVLKHLSRVPVMIGMDYHGLNGMAVSGLLLRAWSPMIDGCAYVVGVHCDGTWVDVGSVILYRNSLTRVTTL